MTTAPDLPVAPDALPAAPLAPRPPLALVPPQEVGERPLPITDDDFDELLRRAVPRLTRYAARRLQDPGEAQEVVQEALLRGFQHRGELATEDDLMAWLTV